MSILITLGIGLLAGILSGLMGIGGGIVMVPMLVAFAGMTQLQAQGTSLGALSLPIGLFAAFRYYKSGNIDIKTSIILAAMVALGGYFGASFANNLPQETVRQLFGVLLVAVGIKFIFF